MNEETGALLLPSGAIGGLYAAYGPVEFENETLYRISEIVFARAADERGRIRPCRIDEYLFLRDKECRFRAGDVIYRARSVTDPRRTGIRLNNCVTSTAALIEKCDGFCIDTDLAGAEAAEDIAESTFFVLPADFPKRKTDALGKYADRLCECGMITGDGVYTFLKNGKEIVSFDKSSLKDADIPRRHTVRDTDDYRSGCINVFAGIASLKTGGGRDLFPARKTGYKDPLAYRIGLAAASARGYKCAKPVAGSGEGKKKLYAVPLPCFEGVPDIPAWHRILESEVSLAAEAFASFRATVTDAPPELYPQTEKTEIICGREKFASTGYIAVMYND